LILPRDIKTKNKIRDAKILQLYLHDKETHENIAVRFGITRTRVSQIIYKNAHLLQFQRNTEKVARINHLKRMLENHPDRMSKKSTLDILEQLRKELEGEKGVEVSVGVTVMPSIIKDGKEMEFKVGNRITS
jgi:predicted DNA-binding protein YlxM (UPF0122 family)